MTDLERTVNLFRQPQVQQLPQMAPSPITQAPATQGIDFQQILSIINAQKQMQQLAASQTQASQSQPAGVPNLAAVVSQLTGSNPLAVSDQPRVQSPPVHEDNERKRTREWDSTGNDVPPSRGKRSKKNKQHGEAQKHGEAKKVCSMKCNHTFYVVLRVLIVWKTSELSLADTGTQGIVPEAKPAISAMNLVTK